MRGRTTGRARPCAYECRPVFSLVLLVGMAIASRSLAQDGGTLEPPTSAESATVTLHDGAVFRIARGAGGLTAQQRAQRSTRVLEEVVESAAPDQIVAEGSGTRCRVIAGRSLIVDLDLEDARAAGDRSCAEHASAIADRIRAAVKREQQRSRVANTVFSASLVVFFGLVTLYLLRKLYEFSARSRRFLVSHPQRVPALRLKRLEVLGPAAVRSVLLLLISLGHGLGMFGLAYTWLVLSLSLFVSTRPYVERLTGVVVTPLSQLVARVATALPLFIVALIAVALIAVVVRIAELFFASVARGETRLGWLEPDLAHATSTLVRAGLVLFAMVFAAPVITGDPNGAISRTGMIVLFALALASTPLLASLVAGVALAFSRSLRLGDRVEYGGRSGRVLEIGVFVMTLGDDDGSTIRVPHALSLFHPTRIHARGDA